MKIVVAGGGILGSQIAFQAAYCGYDVTIWLRSENFLKETQDKIDALYTRYTETIKKMANPESRNTSDWEMGIARGLFDVDELLERASQAYHTLRIEYNLKECVKYADFIIESIPENYTTKSNFFKMLVPLIDDKTIVATSSSSMCPSKFAKIFGKGENFLSLHFSNPISKNNIAEVMVHRNTSNKVFSEVLKFAQSINMNPLPIMKENKGYLLNAMLLPFLFSALDLYTKGISDVESIDKAWIIGTSSPKGPFQIIDKVGTRAVYDVVQGYTNIPGFIAPYDFKGIAKVLKHLIDQGKLGEVSGEGFYKYKK